MSSPSDDSRLPKKQRLRDEAPPDAFDPPFLRDSASMDCDNHDPILPSISYKDKLTGGSDSTKDDDLLSLDDDDIDLLEEDIETGVADGIPFIIFSDRVQELAIKSMDFTLDLKEHPCRIMAWVRLPGLPITWYKRSLIEAIGARIGTVVKIDYQTDYGRRGKFACMVVNINLGKPLVSKIAINGEIQCVEYESLPMVCFKCGLYGHVSDLCSQVADSEVVDAAHACPKGPIKVVPEEAYGPCMLVEQKQRRPPKNVRPATPPSRSVPPQES
ncbi:hypothetical protein V6N11_050222 [Hibiscus sabdariffa]|uniref:Uncharacterized protein n=2 Tax=Hibiscus sabdariffa TaxID=183260 RepID=A0ABR1ZZA8_9ROSI